MEIDPKPIKVLVEVVGRMGGHAARRLCEGYLIEGPSKSAIDRLVILPMLNGACWVGMYVSRESRSFPNAQYFTTNVSPVSPLEQGWNPEMRELMMLLYPYVDTHFELRDQYADLKILAKSEK